MAAVAWIERPDEAIVRRVLGGRRDDFAVLVNRHINAVRAVAMSYVGPTADADDIAQEAFARALEKLDTLRDFAKFRSWLLTIVRRLCLDTKREQATEVASGLVPAESETAIAPDQGREELRRILLDRIYTLEQGAREVLLLHYYAGLSTREIAGELEIEQEAVKKRLQRARDALSRDLSEDLRDLLVPEKSADVRARQIATSLAALSVPWETSTSPAPSLFGLGGWISRLDARWLSVAALVALVVIGMQWFRQSTPPRPNPIETTPAPSAPSPTPPVTSVAAVAPTSANSSSTDDGRYMVAQASETPSTTPVAEPDPGPRPPIGNILVTVVDQDGRPVSGRRSSRSGLNGKGTSLREGTPR